MVDGVLPEARSKVQITRVHSNHAKAEEVERLPLEDDVDDEEDETAADADDEADDDEDADDETTSADETEDKPHLGSRDNFWGG
jgi:hypothetical protein